MQPEINIGLVGHVDHGKTTLTKQLSGKWTDTHSEELKRGITIRLGYADTEIRKNPRTGAYTVQQEEAGVATELVRKISLIDAPGHESLMATMIAGASLMDGALLLVAANEHVPQAQTVEHIMTLQTSGIQNVIVVQNKIDLVSSERAMENYAQIRAMLAETEYKDAPVIPISAEKGVNIDSLLEAIQTHIPTPVRDEKADPLFYVARSFDINKPGSNPEKLQGGILGGAVVAGTFHANQEIEIRPGRIVEEANKKVAHPIRAHTISLTSGSSSQEELSPGGSSAVMTTLDPSLTASDNLAGSVVGIPGKLPPIWSVLTLETTLLARVIGESAIEPLKLKELLMLNVNSSATIGVVSELSKGKITVHLRVPVCARVGEKITLSRRMGTRFRLIGYGVLVGGESQD